MGTDWVAPVVGGLAFVYVADKVFGKDKKGKKGKKSKMSKEISKYL